MGPLIERGSEKFGLQSEWQGWVSDFYDNILPQLSEAQRTRLFANARRRSNIQRIPNPPESFTDCTVAHQLFNDLGIFALAAGEVPLWCVAELRKNQKSPYSYYPDHVAADLGSLFL